MIYVEITPEQLKEAKSYYEFGRLNGSITKGDSNLYGAIGEIVVRDTFKHKHKIECSSTYDYDLIIDGKKVDVKTKAVTSVPMDHYICSVSDFNTHQNCDYYFFARVDRNELDAYLLGFIKKEDFYKKAFFKKKGEKDFNGFIFKDDCYNLEIKDLIQFEN